VKVASLPFMPEGAASLPFMPEGAASLPFMPEGAAPLPFMPEGAAPLPFMPEGAASLPFMPEGAAPLIATEALNGNRYALDEVQALKAGLMEIADVLVVNKADRPGAANTARALEMVINRNSTHGEEGQDAWRPPILQTIALDGSGVPEVLDAIRMHREHLCASGLWAERERERVETELRNVLQQELLDRVLARVGEEQMQMWVERIAAREVDVYVAMQFILNTD